MDSAIIDYRSSIEKFKEQCVREPEPNDSVFLTHHSKTPQPYSE